MVEVSINETIAQYSWSPCTWNHVKLHKEFNSWKIQINKKENILPLMDLKTLTWGEGTYRFSRISLQKNFKLGLFLLCRFQWLLQKIKNQWQRRNSFHRSIFRFGKIRFLSSTLKWIKMCYVFLYINFYQAFLNKYYSSLSSCNK